MSGADFLTEEQRLAQFPYLRSIVETLQLHAGAGYFYGGAVCPGDPCGWGWSWELCGTGDDPRGYLSFDCEADGEALVMITFDGDDNKDQGPASLDPDGHEPTVALAEACGRWIASKIGLTNTSGRRLGGLVVATD